jgi:ABC-type sugar transport system permease subunit
VSITIPLLTPLIFFNLVLQMIFGFTVFTAPFIISGGSGAPLDSGVALAAATPARPPAVWTMPAVRRAMPANDATMAAAIRVRGVRRIRAILREG